ncbi:MFS transporter [Flavobacterium praedii]|uniref:MFS transporter n=1 Tax=Flavobacterium praedii TaxID=3002900 RepID=UPI002481A7D8|nr:MFS transporter [Flavobacterium praedii]
MQKFFGIANDLQTTVAAVSMSLSSYFIGISAGQLLYGPLLDHFGRKKTIVYWIVGLYFGFARLCITFAPFAKNTGSASALMGATQLVI